MVNISENVTLVTYTTLPVLLSHHIYKYSNIYADGDAFDSCKLEIVNRSFIHSCLHLFVHLRSSKRLEIYTPLMRVMIPAFHFYQSKFMRQHFTR